MHRFFLWFAVLGPGLAATTLAVEVGQSWSEVKAELGKPDSQVDAAGRSIVLWGDLEVTFVDGRVKGFVHRDLAAEAASEARRKQEAETVRKLREEVDNENRRREEERLAQEERDRPERERKAQAEKIAALEAQLAVERQKLTAMIDGAAAERAQDRKARIASLSKELATLRMEIQRARADGETERVARLHEELVAKDHELTVLVRQND